MEKRDRWVVKNKILAMLLLNVLCCSVFSFLLALLKASVWLIIILDLFFIWVNTAYPSVCMDRLLKNAIKTMDDYCDPEPLLNETEFLLGYKNSVILQQNLLINKSTALSELGKTKEAYDILISLNIDKAAGTPVVGKIVYYNNVMVFAHRLGMNELADISCSKMLLMYSDIKSEKIKENIRDSMILAEAYAHSRKAEYSQVIECLNRTSPVALRAKIATSLEYAKAYLALGETEKAKDYLVFVIVNGNKLACVKEAQEILKTTPYADILKSFSVN